MKRSLISITIIGILIVSYLIYETIYINKLAMKLYNSASDILISNDDEQNKKINELAGYMTNRSFLNKMIIKADEIEVIMLTITDLKSSIENNKQDEINLYANDLMQHTTHLYSSGIYKLFNKKSHS